MKILVTGFEAFGGESLNPTGKIVQWIESDLDRFAGVSLRTRVLPVAYDDSFSILRGEIQKFQPDSVLCLGLAGGRDRIDLERVAINWIDAEMADNNGVVIRDRRIEPSGMPAYFSTLPLTRLQKELQSRKIPARISLSAGAYVCNFIYYRLLEMSVRSTRRCGFIHFPYLPEQASARPGAASLPWETMVEAVEIAIGVLSDVGRGREA